MRLEQRMEQAEEQLERNEENKQRVANAQRQLRNAENRANSSLAQVQRCQNQLQQAIAARNAAEANREEGESIPPSYDVAVDSARAELDVASQALYIARREIVEASENLRAANGALEQSTQELSGMVAEFQQRAERYGIEMRKAEQLMALPESQIASPLLQRLGIGLQRLNDLRSRIAASLGINFVASSGFEGVEPAGGGRGIRAKVLSRFRSDMIPGNGTTSNAPSVYFNGPMSGFRRIEGSHSIETDLAKVNPNYSHTNRNSVWNVNCQRCVMAYEARRRGYDVEALPVPGGQDSLPIMNHPNGWPTVYKNPNPIECSANSGTAAKMNVDEQMEQWGDNCRAIVRVRWKPEYGGGGHVFIAERINGVTRYIDPQNNCTDAKDYFMDAMGQGVYCMRTDDQEFSDKIKLCCKNRGG